ncbi:hypothetical protein D3C80_2097600 [compost metagenome]
MVEINQMLTPEVIKRLHDHRLFDVGHDLRTEALCLLGSGLVSCFLDTGFKLFFGDTLFLGPVFHR